MTVSDFILGTLQKKYDIDKSVDLDTFNYVESGYVDSIGIIQFVTEIEDHFGVTFSDEELASPSFQVTGQLIKLIESKLQ